ncbi:MAG: 4-hydroxythreonine-4-phosphate dehydrogenase PdxA [Aquificota bacterium]|nr:4-hydroxythreonine-4-phosphate dehydrogenase PdxA [Aquificota bacterium]
MSRIGITIGDPAGVGPELIVKLSQHFKDEGTYVIYGEKKTLLEAERLLSREIGARTISSVDEAECPGVYLIDLNISDKPVPEPSLTSGKVAVAYLARAVVDAVCGKLGGILTMPINKFWASRAGFSYEGQTEYLAQATNTKEYAMMMYSDSIKVLLFTTHIPLQRSSPKGKEGKPQL